MTESVRSINGIAIRLTDERWRHVVENHDDLAGRHDTVLQCVEEPEWVLEGDRGELPPSGSSGARLWW